MKPTRYAWASWGDVNAFFGLMVNNVAVLVLLVSVVSGGDSVELQRPGHYTFTAAFALRHMIPGTALGVLLGNLIYSGMAFRLARRTGRLDIAAMPLGLDTPSAVGVALLVLLPTLQEARLTMSHEAAMSFAWHVGAVVLVPKKAKSPAFGRSEW